MLYAVVDGEKRLPEKGLWGKCPGCGETVISKCGSQVTHHWAHKSTAECDNWSEPVGPWHMEWQSLVQPEYVEVVMAPHRADILGNDDVVVELQHSSIPEDHIKAREAFYGKMIWLFDATDRFEMVRVGQRTFFSLRRTKHISLCSKPVFLDFGRFIVEVEAFTSALAKLDGFGLTRSREWFVGHFLSDRLRDNVTFASFNSDQEFRWFKHKRFAQTKHKSVWNDPDSNAQITVPKGALCLPLDWYFGTSGDKEHEWERLIDQHSSVANGWTKEELKTMGNFLKGKPIIIDGLLRLMPTAAEKIPVKQTVLTTENLLSRVENHISAGRLPILKESTKNLLIMKAREFEIAQYGFPLYESPSQRRIHLDQPPLF